MIFLPFRLDLLVTSVRSYSAPLCQGFDTCIAITWWQAAQTAACEWVQLVADMYGMHATFILTTLVLPTLEHMNISNITRINYSHWCMKVSQQFAGGCIIYITISNYITKSFLRLQYAVYTYYSRWHLKIIHNWTSAHHPAFLCHDTMLNDVDSICGQLSCNESHGARFPFPNSPLYPHKSSYHSSWCAIAFEKHVLTIAWAVAHNTLSVFDIYSCLRLIEEI